ncbi:matrixin family metalloprotease [Actinomadura sp. 9N407]|uniref:matrixin family metalloprotease n=1 Tax=Actinomadura sp. 9N407 TaxID=3375154 RepID=UPI003796D8CD
MLAIALAFPVTPAVRADRPPDWCGSGPGLRAGALPPVVDLRECDLRGKLIKGVNGVAAVVPRDGGSVVAHMLHRHEASDLEIRVDAEARTATITENRIALPGGRPREVRTTSGGCSDKAYKLGTSKWRRGTAISWHYHRGTVKDSGLGARRAAKAVRRGVSGAVGGRTDCVGGSKSFRPKPDIRQRYAGTTGARPNIGGAGDCGDRDGTNSFGWTDLSSMEADALAVTCLWHVGGTTQESDLALQTRGKRWWTPRVPRRGGPQPIPGCPSGRYEAVSVTTHEMLHALGLQHIEGTRHENLSMSPFVRPCDDRAATLGKGDHRGLIKLYGAR